MKKEFTLNYGGKNVTIETGRLAKQAHGAVLVSCEGTQVLVTVCSNDKPKEGQDFFPLTVDYNEKFYAAGKFLGGFNKRETRASTREVLTARLIDRPIRPLFPEGYMCDTFVQATVYSFSPKADPEVLAGIGASAALSISNVPFNGPVATAKVGRIKGQFVLNPTRDEWDNSDMEIVVAGSKDAILMVEGQTNEISEKEILDAILFGHENIKHMVEMIEKMTKEVGKKKRSFAPILPNETLMKKVEHDFTGDARSALEISSKVDRNDSVSALNSKVADAIAANPSAFGLTEKDSSSKEAYKAVDALLYKMMRHDILKHDKRIGGRGLNVVRPIATESNVLATPHGSALFTRGETQVLSCVTIGGSTGDQMVDDIAGKSYQKFYLHYAFPPFSVGEARGIFRIGRRELGHGNLAERALEYVIPAQEDFAYTIRIMCEVLESNGSSSMGSVCSGSMALMDAGVPLKKAVAGIAMGLIKEGSDYKILTDILGDEDHLGDMDFKVAGTDAGVTAIQMDIKIAGLTSAIMLEALQKAQVARLHILGEMNKTISHSREELKPHVPRAECIMIPKDKIGALIGPGGKNIKALQEQYGLEIEIDDTGLVKAISTDAAKIKACLATVDMQINGPKIGTDFDGEVVTIKEYGCFVDIAPGVSGLVHISELANDRVNDIGEYVSEGDKIRVRVVDIDNFGRLKMSAKAVHPLEKKHK